MIISRFELLDFIRKNLNYTQQLRYDVCSSNDKELVDRLFAKEVAYQEIIDFIENGSIDAKSKPD